jgi:cell division protein FtsW (lipid II flippase)
MNQIGVAFFFIGGIILAIGLIMMFISIFMPDNRLPKKALYVLAVGSVMLLVSFAFCTSKSGY